MADVHRDYLIAGDDIAVDSLAPVEPGDVGTELRAARQARRIDIAKVATDLKIREDFLLAIENARYGDLPGIPYAIGYVRTYATYLGLDSEDLVTRFKDETQGLHAEPDLAFPTPVKAGRLGGPALIGVSLVLAGLAYGSWYYYSRTADDTVVASPAGKTDQTKVAVATPAKKAAPAATAVTLPKAQTADATPPADRAAAPEAKTPQAKTPQAKTPETKMTAKPAPLTAAPKARLDITLAAAAGTTLHDPAPPKPRAPIVVLTGSVTAKAAPTAPARTASRVERTAPASRGKVVAAPTAQPKILLRATGLTWIRIQDRSGKIVLSRLLRRGTSVEVPPQAGLTLHVGRANRLQVMVDGKVVPAMYKESLPISNVSLDPKALKKRH